MKNGRFTQCLLVDCNGRTNLVSSSAQSLEYLCCLTQVCRLTDDLILQRDQRVSGKHDGIGARLCNGHSFSNGVPERDFAQGKSRTEFFRNARRGDFEFESTFGQQCNASGRTGCQH